MALTINEILGFRTGTVLHHRTERNRDGTPLRARVNGKCQTWRTRPGEYKLPMKYGLKECFYITQRESGQWFTSAERALDPRPTGEDLKRLHSIVVAVWQQIGYDAEQACLDAGEEVDNESAIEMCLDADRPLFNSSYDRNKAKANQEFVNAMCDKYGYDEVYAAIVGSLNLA